MFKKRTPPMVSIIIPSWFEEGQDGKYGKNETFWFANECLKRLKKVTSRKEYELIIIDNGSTMGGVEDYFKQADILIRNPKNLGFGPACNQGFAIARGEYIVCLNNDILVWPGWLKAMIEPFSENLMPRAGVIMPALMRETRDAREAIKKEKVNLSSNYNAFSRAAEFGSLWCAPNKLLKKIAERRGGYYVFDEDFLLGFGEDRLLWQEVRKLGYETYRTHRTRVFHQGNMSIGKVTDRKKYTIKNREKLIEKKDKLWEE